jgi:Ser/Thr protein kinase RdoA (MazF antagonist)
MSGHPLHLAAVEVLRKYPCVAASERLVALGNCGGFSGAALWRVENVPQTFCLRAWPVDDRDPGRLRWIHHLMRQALAAGLTFVPEVFLIDQGSSVVEHSGRLWDLTRWLPGEANFQASPSLVRMERACTALAQLHGAWVGTSPRIGPCPAVERRLLIADEWMQRTHSGWQPRSSRSAADTLQPWLERACMVLRGRLDFVSRALAGWADRPLQLQPCLCDIWHAHVLFEGDAVTGLIDFGSVKVDHVAVDLARLLGSLAGDDGRLRDAGLQAYQRLRPLSVEEQALVTVLDQTGAIIALATWLKRLALEGRHFEDSTAIALRLGALIGRIEKWSSTS